MGWKRRGFLKSCARMGQHHTMVMFLCSRARELCSNSSLATYHAPAVDPVCLEILVFSLLIGKSSSYFPESLQGQDDTAHVNCSAHCSMCYCHWWSWGWCCGFHLCYNFPFFKFWVFILLPPCSFNEIPYLARALLSENSIWNPFRKLTLLEPTPFRSSEFLLIAIWLFLVSSSVCSVQAGKVHPAEGAGLREL